jgi:hypothetical protein
MNKMAVSHVPDPELPVSRAGLFGPFWEHALGYWLWHVDKPEQVFFLTYEELANMLGNFNETFSA